MRRSSRHHRRPRSLGGSSESSNISSVGVAEHRAWHTLFYNDEAQHICQIINDTWLDPDYEFICVPRNPENDIPISEAEEEYYFNLYQRRKKE